MPLIMFIFKLNLCLYIAKYRAKKTAPVLCFVIYNN